MQTSRLLPIVALILATALLGCGSKPTASTDSDSTLKAPRITNPAQATRAVQKLQELTETSFEKLLFRQPLEATDIANLETAEPVIERLREFDPVSPSLASSHAKVHMGLGRYDKAETVLKNALLRKRNEAEPTETIVYAGMYADLSRVHFANQRLDDALEAIRQARGLLPQDPWFMTDEASVLVQLERHQEAAVLCNQALAVDPGHLPAKTLLQLLTGDIGSNEGSSSTDAP